MTLNLIEEVKGRISLRSILDGYLGQPIRDRYLCPYHDDHSPSLTVRPGGQSFKCWSCPASGSVIDLAMHFEGLASPLDAARFLAENFLGATPSDWSAVARLPRPVPPPKVKPIGPEHWRAPSWQSAADRLIDIGARNLADPTVGWDARAWLTRQGITAATIARRRLGFFPADVASEPLDLPIGPDGATGPIRAARGIVFPWLAPGMSWYSPAEATPGPRWCGANVRRFGPDIFAAELPAHLRGRKYRTFEGSERGHGYPFPTIDPSQMGMTAWLFEGERDSLLAEQEAGDIIHAFSFGGASQVAIKPATLAALACCPCWFVVGDRDAAGVDAARRLLKLAGPKARSPVLPFGKDLSDFAEHGGDVRDWIVDELRERGLA